jgi:hypothetical protein
LGNTPTNYRYTAATPFGRSNAADIGLTNVRQGLYYNARWYGFGWQYVGEYSLDYQTGYDYETLADMFLD